MRPMELPFAPIGRGALFDRLALGHAGRLTVLTPNRRLAAALVRAFDEDRARAGLVAWESADVLSWSAFVERTWDEALHAPHAGNLPVLLAPAEEQALWESIIADSRHAKELLSPASTAAACREAWQLLHGWRIASATAAADGNEDAKAFGEWSARYERATREGRFVDSARLPDALARLLGKEGPARPSTLVLHAFDLVTPQMRALLDAFASAGTEVLACDAPGQAATAARVPLASPGEEIAAAARWARTRLESGTRAGRALRIGVVIPDLSQSRLVVERVFAATLHPGGIAPGGAREPRAFGLSLGLPLPGFAIARDALLVLRLAGREIAFDEASRLLRSPFLAGAQDEAGARARLDAALRERAAGTLTLDRLVGLLQAKGMPRAPRLAEGLDRLAQFRHSDLFGARMPPDWAKAFADALRVAGFPGDRALDSAEFQTLHKWHEVLAAFARLERVTGKMGFQEALGRLARLAADTLFQPESPEVPVQVMGILESAGLDFDHLWVMGLTDDAWPLAARPNPFLPVHAQRAAGMPEADAASSLALDRRITQGWLRAAPEVVVSHALAKGDAQAAPSPLIAGLQACEEKDLACEPTPSWRDAIHEAARLERLTDERGPAPASGAGRGGTALFRDQAACPFRAFAAHRLGSSAPEVPQPGLTAADRGTLVHAVLARAWEALRDKGALDSAREGDLDALLARAAGEALERFGRRRPHVVEGRFAALERGRLASTVRAWLDYERGRGDFEVLATESKVPVTFGGVTVNAKLDRVDRLAGGGCAVIDYKTGEARVATWLGPRPDEPQLPMYALAGGQDVAAVVYAQVKAGKPAFKGLARAENLLPGTSLVTRDGSRLAAGYADWTQLLEGWQRELDALGRAIAAGDARLDPKRGAETCKSCDHRLVCRVADNPPGDPDESGDERDE